MLKLDINLVFTVINLLIIYFIVSKFLFQPVKNILAKRQEELDKQYADAAQPNHRLANCGSSMKSA